MKNKYPIRAKNETGDVTVDVQEFVVPDSAITAGSGYVNLATATGDVTGPASATNEAATVFDGTTGKTVKDGSAVNVLQKRAVESFTTTATAAGTTTLTVASNPIQVFTGTTTQTVTLPVVTTLPKTGFQFHIINNSTGLVTVNSSGANAVQAIAQGGSALITCVLLTGTTAASWDVVYAAPADGAFDIRIYGAKVDGTTDDAAAINAALVAAVNVSGGSVFFPPGITKISSAVSANFNVSSSLLNGDLVLQGLGGSSRVLLTGLAANVGIEIGNCNSVTYRDLFVEGSTTGAVSTATADCSVAAIKSGYVTQTIFDNCVFAGLYCSGSGAGVGVIVIDNGAVTFNNCRVGGTSVSYSGVVSLNACTGFTSENTQFIDYYYAHGIMYNKLTVGVSQSWVTEYAPLAGARNALQTAAFSIKNSVFDEGCSGPLLVLGNQRDLYIEGSSFNCGQFAASQALQATGFANVVIKNCWAGLDVDEFEAMDFANCGSVEIDGLTLDNGAQYLTISGTTSRVKIRNSDLQGSVTYPIGLNNTANAFIDSSFGMPATASATALAPLGKTTHITGTTAITSITTTNLKPGDELRFIFDDVLTFTDGNNLKLAGNFVTTTDDTITLAFDGTNFYEVCRSVN